MKVVAKLLGVLVLCVLLLGSCAAPLALYVQSPRWGLADVDLKQARTFFVAYRSSQADGSRKIHVVRYGPGATPPPPDADYHFPDGRHMEHGLPSEGSAHIDVKTEQPGTQMIQVFVTGDTPWSSLSEYRVAGNKVVALRHAHSAAWWLLGLLVLPYIVLRLKPRIDRGIRRLLRVEPPS